MIKLHYRPPDMRDQTQSMPFVPGGAPLCSDHLEEAENCGCGVSIPNDVRTVILYSLKQREKTG